MESPPTDEWKKIFSDKYAPSLPPVGLHELLNSENNDPGVMALYERAMQHRSNEALNGLSHRIDKVIEQAEKNGKAQGRQQWVMIGLTVVLALATVAYTVTTVWSTAKTMSGQQTVYVSGSGAVPESAAVHMGTDSAGHAAVCINGSAYDLPSSSDARLKGRYPVSPDGHPVMILKCNG
ncbi:hypothetical protein R70006_06171 [Paraburkholderia domus]|uniref:hypothetical protein n=1 Tax=Paraburkholderia domus TaxID=2793075 RepID=UPI0019126AF1|nr:hypothetical protein [Paraburkholderia domus]MBK5052806.1 hypothetical protein [Burkholderia sp. R-70006]CAE6820414.1 hypothetical protein R70006_06171 [Paraburkholderia domus]